MLNEKGGRERGRKKHAAESQNTNMIKSSLDTWFESNIR